MGAKMEFFKNLYIKLFKKRNNSTTWLPFYSREDNSIKFTNKSYFFLVISGKESFISLIESNSAMQSQSFIPQFGFFFNLAYSFFISSGNISSLNPILFI